MGKTQRTTSRWKVIRKLAWERDKNNNSPCHLCGQPIDYNLPPSSSEIAWEPDHLLTFKDRPDLELDLNNILPSHRRCNRARGTKDSLESSIGQHSRIW